ncbi:MAG: SDR family NAD(P)-dependent oxidoreductase [gamma proteobacterium symbiont of Taylorina sp.]|nr:SDR family NAD(P)-dependent oxidoreductase [gamma proteobacterium symbiont of Taylorina sp.]
MDNVKLNSKKVVVVAGVGDCLGTAFCEEFIENGYQVVGLSRSGNKKNEFGNQYLAIPCDLTNKDDVNNAVNQIKKRYGSISVYIHNAAYLYRAGFLQTSAEKFIDLWKLVCLGAIHGLHQVIPYMLNNKEGTVLIVGATASIKGGAEFSAFSSAKFALRGLTQSLLREYSSKGIHISHVVIDGPIWGEQAKRFGKKIHECILPRSVATNCLNLVEQDRSAWTHELDIRTQIQNF